MRQSLNKLDNDSISTIRYSTNFTSEFVSNQVPSNAHQYHSACPPAPTSSRASSTTVASCFSPAPSSRANSTSKLDYTDNDVDSSRVEPSCEESRPGSVSRCLCCQLKLQDSEVDPASSAVSQGCEVLVTGFLPFEGAVPQGKCDFRRRGLFPIPLGS